MPSKNNTKANGKNTPERRRQDNTKSEPGKKGFQRTKTRPGGVETQVDAETAFVGSTSATTYTPASVSNGSSTSALHLQQIVYKPNINNNNTTNDEFQQQGASSNTVHHFGIAQLAAGHTKRITRGRQQSLTFYEPPLIDLTEPINLTASNYSENFSGQNGTQHLIDSQQNQHQHHQSQVAPFIQSAFESQDIKPFRNILPQTTHSHSNQIQHHQQQQQLQQYYPDPRINGNGSARPQRVYPCGPEVLVGLRNQLETKGKVPSAQNPTQFQQHHSSYGPTNQNQNPNPHRQFKPANHNQKQQQLVPYSQPNFDSQSIQIVNPPHHHNNYNKNNNKRGRSQSLVAQHQPDLSKLNELSNLAAAAERLDTSSVGAEVNGRILMRNPQQQFPSVITKNEGQGQQQMGSSGGMANPNGSVIVKLETSERNSPEQDAGDEILDLRKSTAEKQCVWCGKSRTVAEGGVESEFCSEVCFHLFRRDSFKKRSNCAWCSGISSNKSNNNQSISNGSTNIVMDESRFCSEECLTHYKVKLFCEETSAHLEQLKEFQMNGALTMNGNRTPQTSALNEHLITPELWLKKQAGGGKKGQRSSLGSPNQALSSGYTSPAGSPQSSQSQNSLSPTMVQSLQQIPNSKRGQTIEQCSNRMFSALNSNNSNGGNINNSNSSGNRKRTVSPSERQSQSSTRSSGRSQDSYSNSRKRMKSASTSSQSEDYSNRSSSSLGTSVVPSVNGPFMLVASAASTINETGGHNNNTPHYSPASSSSRSRRNNNLMPNPLANSGRQKNVSEVAPHVIMANVAQVAPGPPRQGPMMHQHHGNGSATLTHSGLHTGGSIMHSPVNIGPMSDMGQIIRMHESQMRDMQMGPMAPLGPMHDVAMAQHEGPMSERNLGPMAPISIRALGPMGPIDPMDLLNRSRLLGSMELASRIRTSLANENGFNGMRPGPMNWEAYPTTSFIPDRNSAPPVQVPSRISTSTSTTQTNESGPRETPQDKNQNKQYPFLPPMTIIIPYPIAVPVPIPVPIFIDRNLASSSGTGKKNGREEKGQGKESQDAEVTKSNVDVSSEEIQGAINASIKDWDGSMEEVGRKTKKLTIDEGETSTSGVTEMEGNSENFDNCPETIIDEDRDRENEQQSTSNALIDLTGEESMEEPSTTTESSTNDVNTNDNAKSP